MDEIDYSPSYAKWTRSGTYQLSIWIRESNVMHKYTFATVTTAIAYLLRWEATHSDPHSWAIYNDVGLTVVGHVDTEGAIFGPQSALSSTQTGTIASNY